MDQLDRESLDYLRTWLSNRQGPNDDIDHYQTNALIHPNDHLRSAGFPDLHFRRYVSPQLKQSAHIDPSRLHKWMIEFLRLLREHLAQLETLESIRTGFNKRLAQYNVQLAIGVLQTALCCDQGFELNSGRFCGEEFVLVDETNGAIQDVLFLACVCLFAGRPVRLICKTTSYASSLSAAYLADLMYMAGASTDQVQLLVQDSRRTENLPANNFSWRLSPAVKKQSRLSNVAICFNDADFPAATNSILESYFLLQMLGPNLIVLVEESVYELFLIHWSCSYQAVKRTNPEPAAATKIDLNCIDMGLAHRMSGRCINAIRFRSSDELCRLMHKLRKVPSVQVWSGNYLFARQLCLEQLGQCQQFWLNHLPPNLFGRKFHESLIKYYRDSMKRHMDGVYSEVMLEEEDTIERLRRVRASFMKQGDSDSRARLILRIYLNLISKLKSMKPTGLTVNESLIRMKKFHLLCASGLSEVVNESLIETLMGPVGVAILLVRDKSGVKSKSVIIDFIFKNLLLGNAVLLFCPYSVLGARFPAHLMSQHKLPFAMSEARFPTEQSFGSESPPVCEPADILNSSMDSGLNASCAMLRQQLKCPKSVFAVELEPGGEAEAERVNSLVLGLGARRRSFWAPNGTLHCEQKSFDWQLEPKSRRKSRLGVEIKVEPDIEQFLQRSDSEESEQGEDQAHDKPVESGTGPESESETEQQTEPEIDSSSTSSESKEEEEETQAQVRTDSAPGSDSETLQNLAADMEKEPDLSQEESDSDSKSSSQPDNLVTDEQPVKDRLEESSEFINSMG